MSTQNLSLNLKIIYTWIRQRYCTPTKSKFNKNHVSPSKRCISREKKTYCYTFYNENHTTYLYIVCNKKIVFVKKYLSPLWVLAHFSILFAAMITDDGDDEDDGDMMIAQ